MESILDYLRRNLRSAGNDRWTRIAAEVSATIPPTDKPIGEPLLRKIAYGDRKNMRLDRVQPLLDYFHAIDRGDRKLPEPAEVERAA